ncbi:hypothetical protein ADEAN_000957500 [Angomonas deanei]|uniref:Uncharacterized protein n=1 Tax=Angomonas deanei TaxID=59799 RepID=A0A7G2CQA3_9TRYP|nr:hypothetical protein ADEAN_000957500 [Angomonas deanei]
MNSVIVSYVLGRLANIGDVSPKDVHTDFSQRTLTVENFTLRTEKMNSILPFRIDKAEIPKLEIQIPNPMGADPLTVKAANTTVDLPLDDIFSGESELTKEAALENITNMTILGELPLQDESSAEEEHAPGTSAASEEEEVQSVSSASSHFEDFVSCASDSEISDADSVGIPAEEEPVATGLFASLFSRVSSSVSWIWDRQIRIAFSNIALNLPSDFRQNIFFTIAIDSFDVIIDPKQKMDDREELQVITLLIRGAKVEACTEEARSKIVHVDHVEIKFTSVYVNKTLVRKNTTVAFNDTFNVYANESSLYTLLKCHLTRELMLSLPSYCRPFAILRKEKSLWHYTFCCVISMIQDRKKRFNRNLSHIRFYSQARRRYVELLEAAHRHRDVEPFRDELADVEVDLRYADVILFLRQMVQEKFGAIPSTAVTVVEENISKDSLHTSVHCNFKEVFISLPSDNSILISEIGIVTRNEGQNMSIRAVTLKHKHFTQPVSKAAPLLSVETTISKKNTVTQVMLSPIDVRLRFTEIISTLYPFADLVKSLNILTPQKSTSASTAVPAPTPSDRSETLIVAVPHVVLELDDFSFCVEGASFTTAKPPNAPPLHGCVVSVLSIEWAKKSFLLLPVEVRMDASNNVIVSEIYVEINNAVWQTGKEMLVELRRITDLFPAANGATGAQPGRKFLSYEKVARWIRPYTSKAKKEPHQFFLIKGFRLSFEPIQFVVQAGNITVVLSPQELLHGKSLSCKVKVSTVKMEITGGEAAAFQFSTTLSEGCTVCVVSYPLSVVTVCVPDVSAVLQQDGVTPKEGLPLLHFKEWRVGVVEHYTIVNVSDVLLVDDGVHLRDMNVLVESCSDTPTTVQPYMASCLQLSLELVQVQCQNLCAVPFYALTDFGTPLFTFICEEVIPDEARKLFFSGYSNGAIILRADQARVTGCNGSQMLLSIRSSHDDVVGRLRTPTPIPAVEECTLLLTNHLSRLQMNFDCLHTVITLATQNQVAVNLTVDTVEVVAPIPKEAYWCSKVHLIPVVATVAATKAIAATMSVGDDEKCNVADVCVSDIKLLSKQKTMLETKAGTVFSESDSGSTCAEENEVSTYDITIKSWAANCFMNGRPLVLKSVLEAAEEVGSFIAFSKCVISEPCVTDQHYDLDRLDQLYFHAPNRVIVMEQCTFRTKKSATYLSVCRETVVVFKHCAFYAPSHDIIRVSDRTAFFMLTNSNFFLLQEAVHEPSPATAPSQNVQLNLGAGRLTVELPFSSKMTFAHGALQLSSTLTARKKVGKLKWHNFALTFHTECNQFHMARVDLMDADFAATLPSEKLIVSLQIVVSKVLEVPLVYYVVAALLEEVESCRLPRTSTNTLSGGMQPAAEGNPLWKFKKYKLECGVSRVRVNVCTPAKVVVAGLNFSKLFAFARKGSGEECGTIEGNAGLDEVNLFNFKESQFDAVLSHSTHVLVDGTVNGEAAFVKVMCNGFDMRWSSDQLHTLLLLSQGLAHNAEQHAGVMVNETGACVSFRNGETDVIRVEKGDGMVSKSIDFSSVTSVTVDGEILAGRPVTHVTSGEHDTLHSFVSHFGRTLHVSVCVDNNFVQRTVLRTNVQFLNETDYHLHLSSNRCPTTVVVGPWSRGSAPLDLLTTGDFWVQLVREEGSSTMRTPLWSTHSDVANVSAWLESLPDNERITRKFVCEDDGSFIFLSMGVERDEWKTTLVLTPLVPAVHNDTVFTLQVSLIGVESERTIESFILLPGREKAIFSLESDARFAFSVLITMNDGEEVVECSTDVLSCSLNDEIRLTNERNETVLRMVRRQDGAVGARHPPMLRFVSDTIVTIVNETMVSVGIGDSDQNAVSFPQGKSYFLSSRHNIPKLFSKSPNEAPVPISPSVFSDSWEGELLSFSGDKVYSNFLLLQRNDSRAMQYSLLPPLMIHNSGHAPLQVRHNIYPTSDTGKFSLFSETFSVSGGSDGDCTALSRYGYIDSFSFSCGDDFAHEIESSLSVGTCWKGFVPCGGEHYHAAEITKRSFLSPAVVVVGPARSAPLRVVNLSSKSFRNIRDGGVTPLVEWCSWFLTLYPSNEPAEDVSLVERNSGCVLAGNCRFCTTHEENVISVFIVDGSHDHYSSLTTGESTGFPVPSSFRTSVTVSFNGIHVSLKNTTIADALVRLSIGNISTTCDLFSDASASLLATLSGVSANLVLRNRVHPVVAPFTVNLTVNTAKYTKLIQYVEGVSVRLSTVNATVSDYLVYFLIQSLSPLSPDASTAQPHVMRPTSGTSGGDFLIQNVQISPLEMSANWDRSLRPGVPFSLTDVPLLAFVPSIRNVTFRFPQFACTSCETSSEYSNLVTKFYLVEGIRQIPSTVAGISFLRGSVVGAVTGVLGFFGLGA